MKAQINLTIGIDPAAWALEYGLATTDAAVADFTTALTDAVHNGGLIAALRTGWPILATMAELSAEGPFPLTDALTEYAWDALSDDAKERAAELLAEREAQRQWDSYDIDRIREILVFALADQLGTPEREQWGSGDFPGIPNIKIDEWDLERGQSLTVSGTLDRDNAPGLPWTPLMTDVVMGSKEYGRLYVRQNWDTPDDDLPQAEIDAMEQAIREALHGALKAGVAESEYMTSVEAAREWAENDDAQRYTVDGELL